MSRTGKAGPAGRRRVGDRVGGPDRGRRPCIERLEGRLCLSAAPPTWTSIGPAPITDPYQQNVNYNTTYVSPPDITGAVQALTTFPTSEGVGAYVGAPLGGVWETSDLFASPPTWSSNTNAMPSPAIDSVALSPLDPSGDTVFAGTGPTSNGGVYFKGYGSYPNDASLDTGVYLSTDGGQDWQALNPSGSPIYGAFITAVLPTAVGSGVATETVLAGSNRGLYVSTDGGSTFADPTFTNPVLDVIADPTNPQIDYLLAGPDSQGNGAGVYASTDAGQDWAAIDDGALTSQVLDLMPTVAEGAGRLAATTQGAQTLLYMTFERNDNENTYGVLSTTIVDNGDGTVTADWADDYNFGNDEGGGGNNNLGLAIDPSNPAYVYSTGYGGNGTYRIGPIGEGTVTATELTNEDDGSLYDGRSLEFATNPQGHEVLILTSDSGVYGLADPTTAPTLPVWQPLSGNLSVAEMYSVSAMAGPAGALYVAGGTQDAASFQGSLASGTTPTWVSVNGGDGYGTSYDPSAGMIYATSDTLPGLQVAKASDNTIENVSFAGWDQIDNNAGTGFPNLVAVSQADFGDPGQPRAVALSQYGLYEAQPTSLTSGTVTVVEINPAPNDDHTYSALSFGGTYLGQPDPYILYAARGDGTLWFDHTYGAPATQLTSWGDRGVILSLAQDPSDSHHVYALTGDALYVSEDAGQTWSTYAVPPPSAQLGTFWSLAVVPTQIQGTTVNLVVVGGLHGADVLPDDPALGLTSWFSAGANVPNTWVTDFAYVPGVDDLVLGTMGEGAWLLTGASQQLLDAMAGQASTQLAAPSAAQAGASLILSADVQGLTADSPTPTGSVDFYDDATGTPVLLGSGELNASGEAFVLVPQGLTSGSIALEAVYSGDSNFASSQGEATVAVVSTPTVVTLAAPQVALASNPVTLVATVAAVGGGYAPSGTVEFVDNGTDLGTAALDSAGIATLTLPPLSIGTYSLTATYQPSSDGPYTDGQTASPSSLQVIAAPTSISVSAPGVAWSASPLTLVALVGGGAGLSGTVQFVDGGMPLGSAPIDPSGAATLTLAQLAIGTHQVTAMFQPSAGSPFAAGQTAGASTIQVVANPTIPIATQTSLAVSRSPLGPSARTSIKTGGRIVRLVFGAGVSSPMTTPPAGSIELLVGGKVEGISAVDAAGQATFRLPGRKAFGKSVAAVYLGGANGVTPLLGSQSAAFTPRRGRIRARQAAAFGVAETSSARAAALQRNLTRESHR